MNANAESALAKPGHRFGDALRYVSSQVQLAKTNFTYYHGSEFLTQLQASVVHTPAEKILLIRLLPVLHEEQARGILYSLKGNYETLRNAGSAPEIRALERWAIETWEDVERYFTGK